MSDAIPVHGTCAPRFSRVRDLFRQGFEQGEQLGAAVCFTQNGEPVVDLWGGWLDFDKHEEWQRDTLVNTYSTTKGMTALCAHMLVERGDLDVEAPVAAYWPEFAAAGKESIPVRWLLSHQAGLSGLRKPLSAEELYAWDPMVEALAAETPWWEPGTRHGYHALTFGHLVGEVIRRASGKSVGTFFRENVAEPMEADFHIGLGAEHDARTSPLHGRVLAPPSSDPGGGSGGRKLPPMIQKLMDDLRDPSTMSGAAFALSGVDHNSRAWRAAEIPAGNGHGTARSLARIYGALACGGSLEGLHLLEQASIEFATQEQVSGPDAILGGLPMRFGLGFMLKQDFMPLAPNDRAFGHAGAGGSIGMADPVDRVGFGYTLNKMQMGLMGAAGAFSMLKAFYEEI